jgi:hypothetical protein
MVPRKGRTAATLLAALLLPCVSSAYQREDHYYTVRLALKSAVPPLDSEALVAVCSQLPDEAPELSAIDVYRRLMTHPADYSRWVLTNSGPAETVGRMVTIQQLQHGLTGGWPPAVREVARRVIQDVLSELRSAPTGDANTRADAACALGFAFHLYGDSFSHQMLKNPDKMYHAGIGHLFDSVLPDLPLVSPTRFELWKGYIQSAPGLAPHSALKDMSPLLSEAAEPLRSARHGNAYNQPALREILAALLRGAGLAVPYVAFDRSLQSQGCQAMAERQAALNGFPAAPSCERAWRIFSEAAVKEFDAYDADPEHARKSRAPNRVPYFQGSPFSKGPKW